MPILVSDSQYSRKDNNGDCNDEQPGSAYYDTDRTICRSRKCSQYSMMVCPFLWVVSCARSGINLSVSPLSDGI